MNTNCSVCRESAAGYCTRCARLFCINHLPRPGACCADCELEFSSRSWRIQSWTYGVGAISAFLVGGLVLVNDAAQWFHNYHPVATVVCAAASAAGVALLAFVLSRALVGVSRRAFLRPLADAPALGQVEIPIAPDRGAPGKPRRRTYRLPQDREAPPRFWITWWR
jgi:hypothetical protein